MTEDGGLAREQLATLIDLITRAARGEDVRGAEVELGTPAGTRRLVLDAELLDAGKVSLRLRPPEALDAERHRFLARARVGLDETLDPAGPLSRVPTLRVAGVAPLALV